MCVCVYIFFALLYVFHSICTNNGKPNAIGPNNVSSLLKKSLGYYYVREREKGEGYYLRRLDLV